MSFGTRIFKTGCSESAASFLVNTETCKQIKSHRTREAITNAKSATRNRPLRWFKEEEKEKESHHEKEKEDHQKNNKKKGVVESFSWIDCDAYMGKITLILWLGRRVST